MTYRKRTYPRVGLALSGGSALGIAHIGAIKALSEHKIPIDCVSGTSAGAIAAVGLAFGIPPRKMVELSKNLSWSNVSKFGYSRLGLNSNEPVSDIIREMVGRVRIEDARIPLAIIATNIDTGERVILRKGSVAEAIMASTCLPGFFVPVKIKGKKLVDGGLVENLPLSPLKRMGAQMRIGVDLGHWRRYKKTKSVVDVITNSYSILIKPQCFMTEHEAEILIEPHLEKFSSSDFDKVSELMEAGYRAMKLAMPEIKKQLGMGISEPEKIFNKAVKFFNF